MTLFTLRIYFALTFVILLSGCSIYRIDSEDTTLDFYPSKRSLQDVGYLEKIDKPFEVVGMVTVSVENAKSVEEVILKMRQEAAVLGGDAVTGVRFVPEGLIRKRYTGKVVVFK